MHQDRKITAIPQRQHIISRNEECWCHCINVILSFPLRIQIKVSSMPFSFLHCLECWRDLDIFILLLLCIHELQCNSQPILLQVVTMSEYWQSGAYRLTWESKLGINWETKFKRSKALPGIGAEHLNQDPIRSYFLEEYNSLQTRESNLLLPCVWLQLIASLFCFSFLNKSCLAKNKGEK